MVHGVSIDGIDGGAEGSGLGGVREAGPIDRTQGSGTTAWQKAQRMAMEVNARNRRN